MKPFFKVDLQLIDYITPALTLQNFEHKSIDYNTQEQLKILFKTPSFTTKLILHLNGQKLYMTQRISKLQFRLILHLNGQ